MTKNQKKIAIITSIIGIIGFLIWLLFEPSFEPAIGFILSLGGFFSSLTFNSKYKKNRLKGTVKFNYSNNNGIYEIGKNELTFETKWSKASNQSIYLYNDPAIISGIAIADTKNQMNEIKDATEFDFSSRCRTVQKHGIAILKNTYENFAVIRILDIKDNTRGDNQDELHFEFLINPNNKSDFS
ncbi:hypothetical protein [Polaribacter sargassicola]|uniref:hypothetical protein n=1 Tax=Polaribacter sargassicola TaxID=2836891 RepID=UPI001F4820ED|nr:hypothetical protein [Polaribacter sp. DS7-9]MCG1037580.1 hypothetical protein [Polaribacter sp. DS7-9]